MAAAPDPSEPQSRLTLEKSPPPGARLRKYPVISVLNAIFHLIKTGCQWRRLPPHYPKWRTAYNHFRSWPGRGWFQTVLLMPVFMPRKAIGRNGLPYVGTVDSQTIRQVSRQSEKGIDGYRRVKGIRSHIVTDSQGYPQTVLVTTTSVSDARSVYPVICPSHGVRSLPAVRQV